MAKQCHPQGRDICSLIKLIRKAFEYSNSNYIIAQLLARRGGGTGRRAGFKIRFLHGSVGSIPTLGTNR